MKRVRLSILAGLIVVATLLLLWWLKPLHEGRLGGAKSPAPALPATSQTPLPRPTASPSIEARSVEVAKKVLTMLATPINFYGRVVDQNGEPVPDATINYGALDKFYESGSQYQGKSDNSGNFSINGIGGAVLRVGVRKEGYYMIDGKSTGAFAYGVGPDSSTKAAPTKDKPAIFVLQKMGITEPLIVVRERQYKVAGDGRPVEVDLATGRVVPPGKGGVTFQQWANDRIRDKHDRFDWRFRITAPGGLVERTDQFSFEAPREGYKNIAEISMPASLGEKWRYIVNKSYFTKTRTGRYARLSVNIYGGHDYSYIEAFVNPNSDSRNLEFDPKKVVKLP